jgi:carboxypeptidase Q
MMRRLIPVVAAVFLLASGALVKARPGSFQVRPGLDPAIIETDQRIMAEIRQRAQLMGNLEYLSDMIGPRLTGSDKMQRASEWTLQRFQEYRLSNAHLEKYAIPSAWARGAAAARVISPNTLSLSLAAAGWTPGTGGPVRGPIVYVDADSPEAFGTRYHGKLRGAIVLLAPPTDIPPPVTPRAEAPPPPAARREGAPGGQPGRRRMGEPQSPFRQGLPKQLKDEGAVCILIDSGKEHGLLNMTSGRGAPAPFMPAPIASAFVTHEGYSLIWRLLKRGPVEVELDIQNAFSPGPVEVYNTVAELPGAERPDEVVILGAHLDSWDLGTGTTDNGTGSMIVLEAARALKALDLKPRRTIRFILFSGEEEGLVGSKEYVRAHEMELGKISGVLVHDSGTGRVTGIGLEGRPECGPALEIATAPLRTVGFEGITGDRFSGTDHNSFNPAGVPAFACRQDRAEYRKTHHSQSDTFDKAWKDDLLQGAMVLAVWVYNVASLPEMLPRPRAN